MKWSDIRPALAGIVSDLTGIPPASVVWRGSVAATSAVIGTRAILSVNSIQTAGVDIEVYDPPAHPTDPAVVTRYGQRQFTWSILIESQNLQLPARELIDLIRIRLQRTTTITRLNAVGVAVSTFLSTTQNDHIASGRMVTVGIMDVRMLAGDMDIDETIGSGDWIGEAIIDGSIPPNTVHLDVDARDQ